MRLGLLVFLLGCYNPSSTIDEPTPDGPGATPICVGDTTGFVTETCFTELAAEVFAAPALIDTDGPRCVAPVTPDPRFCFIPGQRIQIDAAIKVRGSRPLVLWAVEDISIGANGSIDVAGHANEIALAAGANDTSCAAEIDGKGDPTVQVGTGGCGGPFATDGGSGGDGARSGVGTVVSSCDPTPVTPIDRLRGGCPGGHGGFSTTNGGNSGGAIYLLAGAEIVVSGTINASGGGGAATIVDTTVRQGGGGGGSGGMIAFDAPELKLDGALLLALGGGGGSGTGNAAGLRDGNPGHDPDPLDRADPFAPGSSATVNTNFGGGSPSPGGGNGGDADAVQIGGGGGGGGGHGLILVFPPTLVPSGQVAAFPPIPPGD